MAEGGRSLEMFKIMKCVDKMGEVVIFSRVDSVRTRGHSFKVKES